MKLLNYHPDKLHNKEEMLFGLEAGMKLGHEIHLLKKLCKYFSKLWGMFFHLICQVELLPFSKMIPFYTILV
jgi:hypothetical protein